MAGLNKPQRGVVVHAGSSALVVVGVGSGKTRVLTQRIAHPVGIRGVHPGAVLAITFTNRATAEMQDRTAGLVGSQARMIWISTFHLAYVRTLCSEIDRLGIARSSSIYDDTDVKRLVSLVIQDQELDPKRFPVCAVTNVISSWRNNLVNFETAKEQALSPVEKANAEVYEDYQTRLRAINALDSDDLVMATMNLLQVLPEIRKKYRCRSRHVPVDRYQDTGHARYALIHELCGQATPSATGALTMEPAELMVVGDSDQSIYAFRGTTIRNILDFGSDFPGARTIMLDQNYHSTNTVLQAANAVIVRSWGRHDKALQNNLGDDAPIIDWVTGTEHDEAQFVTREIDRPVDGGCACYGDVAVFCRTNVQSRTFEKVFIRVGMPYRVVGGVRFYEHREIRDTVAYLRAIANSAGDVSVRWILNVPKRGIGDRAVAAVSSLAGAEHICFFEAPSRSKEASGLAARSARQIRGSVDLIEWHRVKVTQSDPADKILISVLTDSGYLAELQNSTGPQDETRLGSLEELVDVAAEFVAVTSAVDLDEEDKFGLAAGMPELDALLLAFLKRIALVVDLDQVPDGEQGQGVMTLMILYTAKGLGFDTMFLTDMEEGVSPHLRVMESQGELREECRLAYVGITRVRELLHLSRVMVRVTLGQPNRNLASRSLGGIPEGLMDWRCLDEAPITWAAGSTEHRSRIRDALSPGRGSGERPIVSDLAVGDRVAHTASGPGTVLVVHGTDPKQQVDVDSGSAGKEHPATSRAPMEKL